MKPIVKIKDGLISRTIGSDMHSLTGTLVSHYDEVITKCYEGKHVLIGEIIEYVPSPVHFSDEPIPSDWVETTHVLCEVLNWRKDESSTKLC